MKVSEIISNLKVGQVVTDKRILCVLKRNGLIYDYSPWGYLESCWIIGPIESDGISSKRLGYLFNGDAPRDSCSIHCETKDKYYEVGTNEIEYMGCVFRTKYLDGCFNAYLELTSKDGVSRKECNPRMSVFGAIV